METDEVDEIENADTPIDEATETRSPTAIREKKRLFSATRSTP